MLIIPNTVSTPIRSSSFNSASATVIFTEKLPDDGVEYFRLLGVAEMTRIGDNLQTRSLRYFAPHWRYLILGAPDQQRRHPQRPNNIAGVVVGEGRSGEFITCRATFGHDRD